MSRATSATGLIALGGAGGLITSLIAYTTKSSGIDGSGGALLVIASSALILAAALALTIWPTKRNWWTGTLIFLLLLGILGTAFAAYLLDSHWLLLAMAVSMVGWLLATMIRRDTPVHTPRVTRVADTTKSTRSTKTAKRKATR